ncbi:importin beta-related nuclear transport receptor (nucleomorph) [Chroomonas mesostigmatica CCMP1168]|uniref:Importin beta-related nuclear transport receptor n=1 Tax=Chroomonas mesostigmatica CCMP1168 TaxID=1195612 RepID=J7G9R4_9CRYP|nr:importin beta-related nuclear transport receptor [Chroomonas mesostigmatica CCMP1168]
MEERVDDSDFSTSIKFLEKNLDIIYNSKNPKDRWKSQKILNKFQNKKDSWNLVFKIFEIGNIRIVYFCLMLLDRIVSFSWCNFDVWWKEKIQNFLTEKVFQISLKIDKNKEDFIILTKINVILIKIVCQSEKSLFYTYMNDFLDSSKKNEYICENNFNLVLIFFEEVYSNPNFEFIKEFYFIDLRFDQIFQKIKKMIFSVLYRSYILCQSHPNLVILSLITLKRLVEISFEKVKLEKNFLEILVILCAKPGIRSYSLECMIELCKNPKIFFFIVENKALENFIIQFHENFFVGENWIDLIGQSNQEILEFLKNSTIFLSLFFENYEVNQCSLSMDFFPLLLEKKKSWFLLILQFMIKISCLPDFEIFKICLEWWTLFINQLFLDKSVVFFLFDYFFFYILIDLKVILISRMPKPEEILIRTDENDQIIRESSIETNANHVHSLQKNLLIKLTSIDFYSTKFIINEKLNFQFTYKILEKNTINALCWSISSVSYGYVTSLGYILPKYVLSLEEEEFLTTIIKNLLYLCDSKIKKDEKSIIASNIMYIVGEFHIFLEKHLNFLRVVINKLFDFIYENHPGIKDMACDVFLKISKKCPLQIVEKFQKKRDTLLDEIFEKFDSLIYFLEFHQKKEFITAIGILINYVEENWKRNFYIKEIFLIFFDFHWHFYFKKNLFSKNPKIIRNIVHFFNINNLIGKILSKKYCSWFQLIFNEIGFMYNWIHHQGENIFFFEQKNFLKSKNLRLLKNLRKEILIIFEKYMEICIFDKRNTFYLQNLYLLCHSIFSHYGNTKNPSWWDFKVIVFCIRVLKKRKNFLEINFITLIFNAIFRPTLEIIKNNFEDFPDIRFFFFLLLDSLVCEYFHFISESDENSKIDENKIETIIHALNWGIKHTEKIISKQTSKTFLTFLFLIKKKKLERYIYIRFSKQILFDVITIITDKLHISNLIIHCKLLFFFLENSKIYVDNVYLNFLLKSIFGKIFFFMDKKYLDKFVILILIGKDEKVIFEEFTKILNLNRIDFEESFSS